jgi:ADP-ribose pyrophosphatase YjhB (NUDIX family)
VGLRRDDRPGIPAIFADIADSCRRLGAPTYATWADCVVAWHDEEPLRSLLAPYAEARIGDMIPLRLFGAIHRLALERQAPEIALSLPTLGGTAPVGDPDRTCRVLLATIEEHRGEIAAALTRVPQTNEVGRTVGLAALLRRVNRAFGLPVILHEIGCSAGLSLRVDELVAEGVVPADHSEWGPMPRVSSRHGCDLAPVDASTTSGRTLLTSFVWPDHLGRFERLRRALDVASRVEADLTVADATTYVEGRELTPGHVTVMWHSAMWLYLTVEQRERIRVGVEGLGASATPESPLAYITLEPTAESEGGEAQSGQLGQTAGAHRFALTMCTWPGMDGVPAGVEVPWGYAPPAGEPVDWSVPCAGAVVRDDAGRILLVRRGQPPSRGLWSLPGGRVEGDEDWAAAAVREVHEETSLVASDPHFVGIVERDSESGATYLIADYTMNARGEPTAGDDADDAAWWSGKDLPSLDTSPGLIEVLRSWRIID